MDGYYARGWLILDDLYLNQLYSGMVVLKSKRNRHSEGDMVHMLCICGPEHFSVMEYSIFCT